MRVLKLAIATLLFTYLVGSISAQDDSCSEIAINAMDTIGEVCGETGRNEVCYGNFRIDTLLHDESVTFEKPSDIVAVDLVEEIHTYGLDVENNSWGLALLRIQANLPDTMPGQNVTFLLYGDVTLTNAGSSNQTEVPETCEVSSTGNINLRSGPSTDYNVAGATTLGQELIVDGRNQASDWLHLQETNTWIFASLTENINCDFATLPIISTQHGTEYGPMQALYFKTGVGQSECATVPPDSLVIRSPDGLTVNLSINGVDVAIASTIALTARPSEDMVISVLEGTATATVNEVTISATAGNAISVPLDETLAPAGPPQIIFAPTETLEPVNNTAVEVFEDEQPLTIPDAMDTLVESGALNATWTGTRTITTAEGECAEIIDIGNERGATVTFSYDETPTTMTWTHAYDDGRSFPHPVTYAGGQTFTGDQMTLTFTSPTSFHAQWVVPGPTSSAACEGNFTATLSATASIP